MKNNQLNLGSDIESFSASLQTRVYAPKKGALGKIVNFVDPIRRNKSIEDFKLLGIHGDVKPFPIGTVRYTSTDRMHRATEQDKVSFCIQPTDFLARRTAVLGMTRTGKSNMIKQTVSVVKKISDENKLKIGQLIFDINGEYANANNQDNGSISDIFKDNCIKYRMVTTGGFKPLLNNFYEEIQDGLFTIQSLIKERGEKAVDIDTFSNMSLEKPDEQSTGDLKRWKVKVALYKTLLYKAGYTFNGTFNVKFEANKKIREVVSANIQDDDNPQCILDPARGFDFLTSEKWFLAARNVNRETPLKSSSGGAWLDSECVAMLNLLAMKNSNDAFIKGYRTVAIAKDYHSPQRTSEVCNEIYNNLIEGKIVILDLSVGNALLRERISKKIAAYIFNSSMGVFTAGKTPSNIVIYIEEAHNLIGKGMDLTETWPRLAKEGAKYKIALVYATQEVSSVHKNILANTENWFVSHLNSDIEIRELSHFYDFSDFNKSLLRSQDVGFTRVKTLSSPYVVPVQIDKFDPTTFVNRGE